jgi:HAD superfamily phosphoserine phosphatase-like hydrolase
VAGALDVHAYVDFATSVWRDRPPQEQADAHARFMREVIGPMLTPQALALVKKHQDEGDLVAIVTATNEFVTRPIAQAFGVPELLAIELARDARGAVTGAIKGVPTYQHGKVTRVGHWLEAQGAPGTTSIASAFTVTPSTTCPSWSGPPTLSRPIRRPRCEAVAAERGWRFLRLFE